MHSMRLMDILYKVFSVVMSSLYLSTFTLVQEEGVYATTPLRSEEPRLNVTLDN